MRTIAPFLLILALTLPVSGGVNTWTSNGPDGGEISAMAVDPADPNTIYAGLGDTWSTDDARKGGGIYKSTDGGVTWTEVNGTSSAWGTLRLRFAVSSLFVESSMSVYAVLDGDTVYRTVDGGTTWQAVDSMSGVLPNDVAAGGGSLFVATSSGIYRSVSGAARTLVSSKNTLALAISRSNASLLVAGEEQGGSWSSDGGSTWTASTGLVDPDYPSIKLPITSLFIDTNGDVYALSRGYKFFVFRSTDGGHAFSAVSSGVNTVSVTSGRQALTKCGDTIYVATPWDGLKQFTGGTWSRVSTLSAGHLASVIRRDANSILVGARGEGVFLSTNNGSTWSASSTGLHGTRVYKVAVHPSDSTKVYAATNGGVFKSTDAGATWTPMRNGMVDRALGVPAIYDIAVDSAGGLLAGGVEKVFTSSDEGATWVDRTLGDLIDPGSGFGTTVRGVAIDPLFPARRYLTADRGFFRSSDGGSSWSRTTSSFWEQRLAITHAAGADLPVVYGFHDGLERTANDAVTWQDVTPTSYGVKTAATIPQNPSIVYLAAGDGIYVTTNSGANWTLTSLVPQNYSTFSGPTVAVAPSDGLTAIAYARKTTATVHKTTDGGTIWTPYMTGMKRWLSCEYSCDDDQGSIFSFAFAPDDASTVYAGTAGHGIYSISVPGPPSVPTGVAATASTTTSVRVAFNAVASATGYDIERRAAGGSFAPLVTVTTNSYTDDSVVAGAAYLYRVRATNALGTSSWSTPDLATTVLFTDDPLVAGTTTVRAVHLAELRSAVGAVATLAGGTASFTGSATAGETIMATHMNELRTSLHDALTTLALSTSSYTDTVTTGSRVRAIHFQELRDRMK